MFHVEHKFATDMKKTEKQKLEAAKKNRYKKIEKILAAEIIYNGEVAIPKIDELFSSKELKAYIKTGAFKNKINELFRKYKLNKKKAERNLVSFEQICETITNTNIQGAFFCVILFKLWSVTNQIFYYQTEQFTWINSQKPEISEINDLLELNEVLLKYKHLVNGAKIEIMSLTDNSKETYYLGAIKESEKNYEKSLAKAKKSLKE